MAITFGGKFSIQRFSMTFLMFWFVSSSCNEVLMMNNFLMFVGIIEFSHLALSFIMALVNTFKTMYPLYMNLKSYPRNSEFLGCEWASNFIKYIFMKPSTNFFLMCPKNYPKTLFATIIYATLAMKIALFICKPKCLHIF